MQGPSTPPASGRSVFTARPRDLGGFSVARFLPSPECRSIGPVVFLDHMGPATFPPGRSINVRPHPHIHLATLTWLFEGAILHRDSTGAEQVIRPGDVNWMMAGRGIVHSERAPAEAIEAGGPLHGIQLWIGLPAALEDSAPSFVHHPSATLPYLHGEGWTGRLIAGCAFGAESPVGILSPLVLADLRAEPGAVMPLVSGVLERSLTVALGSLWVGDVEVVAGQMIVLAPDDAFVTAGPSGFMAFFAGGQPLDGPRFLDWNFVSSRPEKIREARHAWRERRFPLVPGDEIEFIPLPEDEPGTRGS